MNGQSRSVDDALKNSVVKLQEVILLYFSALSLDLLRFSCLPAGPQHPERCPLPLNCNTNELLFTSYARAAQAPWSLRTAPCRLPLLPHIAPGSGSSCRAPQAAFAPSLQAGAEGPLPSGPSVLFPCVRSEHRGQAGSWPWGLQMLLEAVAESCPCAVTRGIAHL